MTTQTKTTWRKVKLGEVALEVRDLYQPSKEEYLPYIGLEHIQPQTLRLVEIGDSRQVQSTKKRFRANDVLFGSLRAYFRKVIQPNFDGVCSTDITVLRPKNGELDRRYLFYLIADKRFVDRAAGSGEGTRMPRAGWGVISKFYFNIPSDISDQKRIADILSAFDDKIELNNKISRTLEQMAQAIFKEWFAAPSEALAKEGKLPKGWRVGKIKDLIDVISGFPFSSKLYSLPTGALGVVTIKNVQDGNFVRDFDSFIKKENLPDKFNKDCYLEDGDILLSLTGNVGRVCFVYGGEYLLNQRVAKLRPKDRKDSAFCYFLFRQPVMQNNLINMGKGSAQSNLSPVETGKIETAIPSRETLDKFNELVSPLYQRLKKNAVENQKLSALRDLLLPKLMSGEIRV